ncbi:MAG: phosphoenolpyruvate synthase [Betaproteobacteria bacterium]|jgi:pyruvate,water dikinase|nr:phosphoenolpyruvate synthase [Pseudomonadota bacterium]NBO02794.1 phosphoenolpyruvate synthase [Betaproteobacteria bacterium]NBO94716.1 phosphoenolpyruvate synthase [Betaproteobacteria bacterium]NBP34883.1 phosphoenolpyruvate synthase [Betaproteobacteria bacterium]NBQ95684.1 phosphoenolpyruvate synthase [Betaproteobacteria bacterium]
MNQPLSERLVVPFEALRMTDVESVGGKNASLGEMISQLAHAGVRVPGGFATTAQAFRSFLQFNRLTDRIAARLEGLNIEDVKALAQCGEDIRGWMASAPLQPDLEVAIREAYQSLQADSKAEISVAVRSSATAEDLPDASFAGQQESFLNVSGINEVLVKVRQVFASLYNDRAIAYRVHQGFEHADVALSAGIQRMVRSDEGSSGVMFTIDTESGFDQVVFITSAYGLGETVVQGAVNPDEFYVHKPMLRQGKQAIVRRQLGSKLIRMAFNAEASPGQAAVKTLETEAEKRHRFSLRDEQVIELARYALIIEDHYQRPMDIEWGLDGLDGRLYILQARPETVKSRQHGKQTRYQLKTTSEILVSGRAIGQKVGAGMVSVVRDATEMDRIKAGDVLVTDMTDPNWEPIMKRAAAIVTNRGGRTCHAAIIARELGIPAVVGCGNATEQLMDGALVTVSCAQGDTGYVYDGLLETEITAIDAGQLPSIPVKLMMNVGNPQLAFDFAQLPNEGVGLARLEFIINNDIGIHPKAILDYPHVDAALKSAVESVARGYASPRDFYVARLAEGVATIAAAFWPKTVIVRLSDFKSNEYRKLIGGSRYEPEEENPMLGFRGASRYLSADFREPFALECEAMRLVRNNMGLNNVELMVPFVRTVDEAKQVIALLAQHGLARGSGAADDGAGALRIIMMCELPSNALLADAFLEHFDGFSIGSNDLTQLTLGLDRDSGLVASAFDERDPAVRLLLSQAIQACLKQGKYVGICGQGPSDHPDLAQWLVQEGIQSISLNPDTVIDTWQLLAKR